MACSHEAFSSGDLNCEIAAVTWYVASDLVLHCLPMSHKTDAKLICVK